MQIPSGKPVPATIGLIFGGLWGLVAASALPPGWLRPGALLAAAVTVATILAVWTDRDARVPGGALFSRRPYRVAVVAEVAAIAIASLVLSRSGLQAYFVPVVGVIVGLHFIGLWQATGARSYLAIMAGMCVISVVAILCPATWGRVHLRDLVAGVGNALVLWWGAGWSRWLTRPAKQRS